MLKSKINKIVKEFLRNANVDKGKIKILFDDLPDLKFHINRIAEDSGNQSLVPIQKTVEIILVVTAEKYMDELLTLEGGGIISEKTFRNFIFA